MNSPSSAAIQSHTTQHHNMDKLIPSQLKFLMSNVKNIIQIQLTSEIFPLWKSQILKLFRVNDFYGYLNSSTLPLNSTTNPTDSTIQHPPYDLWILIVQDLASAILSTIFPSILL